MAWYFSQSISVCFNFRKLYISPELFCIQHFTHSLVVWFFVNRLNVTSTNNSHVKFIFSIVKIYWHVTISFVINYNIFYSKCISLLVKISNILYNTLKRLIISFFFFTNILCVNFIKVIYLNLLGLQRSLYIKVMYYIMFTKI